MVQGGRSLCATPASILECWFTFLLVIQLPIQFPANVPGQAEEDDPVLGTLSTQVETWMKFLACGSLQSDPELNVTAICGVNRRWMLSRVSYIYW